MEAGRNWCLGSSQAWNDMSNNNTITLGNEFDQTNMNTTLSSALSDIMLTTWGSGGGGSGNISESAGVNGTYTINADSGINWQAITPSTKIHADEVVLKGKPLSQLIEKIEERLGILHPNSELESHWDELRELRERYIQLEREILEKEEIMRVLNR